MKVTDHVRIFIYRVHEKGLEVFLIEPKAGADSSVWNVPSTSENLSGDNFIKLEPVTNVSGELVDAYAIEGDWHDIPSIRGLLNHDVKRFKNKIKEIIPDNEGGAYFILKDAIKKVLPQEYAALKELKDIIVDRNTAIHI